MGRSDTGSDNYRVSLCMRIYKVLSIVMKVVYGSYKLFGLRDLSLGGLGLRV